MRLLTPPAAVAGHFGLHLGMVRRIRGWVPPDQRRPHHVCWRHLVLTADQQRLFDQLPNSGGPVPSVLLCRRQANHRGPHLAEGAESVAESLAYWLRWGEVCWQIFPARYCGLRSNAVEFVPAELDFCSLPRRHRGAHTSQYFPLDLRWPDPAWFDAAGYRHRRPVSEDG